MQERIARVTNATIIVRVDVEKRSIGRASRITVG